MSFILVYELIVTVPSFTKIEIKFNVVFYILNKTYIN
jgi:hypothetical protein